jgi:5'-deoxynucleotidase YfbR-like HD superfamily hydrolase
LRVRKEEAAKRLEEIEAQLAAQQESPELELPPELQEYIGDPADEAAYMKWEVSAQLLS